MRKISEREIKKVKEDLLQFIVPQGYSTAERNKLARRANIREETLRMILYRKTLNADTLIRLLLAKGVPAALFSSLPQDKEKFLSKGEKIWRSLGEDLDEESKIEFAALIRYLTDRFQPKP